MFSHADVTELLKDKRLASPVASLYLNTDRTHPEGEKMLAGLRKVVHEADGILRRRKNARSAVAQNRLREALPDITRFLEREVAAQPVVRGVALFVSLAPTPEHEPKTPSFTAFTLPRPVRSQAHVQRRPVVRPLLFLLDQYERVGVIVADRNHARIFTLFLGEIESLIVRQADTPRRHDQGGWSQMLFQRDIDGHIKRHVRGTVRQAVNVFGLRPLKRIVLGGDAEVTGLMRRDLPERLQGEIAGTFPAPPHASDREIVTQALSIAQKAEVREEAARVQECVEALGEKPQAAWGSGSTRRAVCGVEDVLQALTEKRVRRLLLLRGYRVPGGVCGNCGTLTRKTRGACPSCDATLETTPDVLEHAVERAVGEGAEVEFILESPALAALGGVGALLRF